MLTPQAIAEINHYMDSIRTPGVRLVCCFCQAPLPGSDPAGTRTSHGACTPRCAPALAMGWTDLEPSTQPARHDAA